MAREKIRDAVMFVQFPHPGGEHTEASGKVWNKGLHRRKFLRSKGCYVRTLDDKKPFKADLTFWGEWEPESTPEPIKSPLKDGPRTIFTPHYQIPTSYDRHTNTDPFVFGDCFLYSNCRQFAAGKPSTMNRLPPGSVIVFGSCLHGDKFVVDTVFVVKSSVSFRPGHAAKDLKKAEEEIPQAFIDTVVRPMAVTGCGPKSVCGNREPKAGTAGPEFRLYFGVTFAERKEFGGMFSYSPAKPLAEPEKGFVRPKVTPKGSLKNRINPRLTRKEKHGSSIPLGITVSCWEEVTKQILGQGCCLGLDFDTPPKR